MKTIKEVKEILNSLNVDENTPIVCNVDGVLQTAAGNIIKTAMTYDIDVVECWDNKDANSGSFRNVVVINLSEIN